MKPIIFPRMSEKSFDQSKKSNVYTFSVADNANKITVKDMVEKQYNVKVESVNISVTKGKVKRSVKKSGKRVEGQRSDHKKAYVTVAKGDTIPVFAAAAEGSEE